MKNGLRTNKPKRLLMLVASILALSMMIVLPGTVAFADDPTPAVWDPTVVVDNPVDTPPDAGIQAVGTVVNGNFETGNLSGWGTAVSGFPFCSSPLSMGWFAYSGTVSPCSFHSVTAPPQGTFAATSDETGSSYKILYQDITLPATGTYNLSFILYHRSETGFTTSATTTIDFSHQEYRVDLIKPTAAITSLAPADVLMNLFDTKPTDPLVKAPTLLTFNLAAFAGQTVRLRFASMTCCFFMRASVDDVKLVSSNQPPTVAADSASVTVNEGQTAANTGTYSDPNAGDNVSISASVGTVTKTGTNSGTWSWNFGTSDGPAQSQTVIITANDGNGGIATTTFALTVDNVAPTASLGNDGPIDEGGSAMISFSGAFDPSGVDSASLHYAFDCSGGSLFAATYAGSGTTNSTSCTFADNGSYTVSGKIMDKDGGSNEYTTTVTVDNVAPTASLGNNGPIDEGDSANVSFSGAFDPSSVDSASLRYAFDCSGGSLSAATYAGSGTSDSTSCAFADNGSYTVSGKIMDKDGGSNEYTTVVTVDNVAPTITSLLAGAAMACGQSNGLTINFDDPALANDTYSANVDWGDGNSDTYNAVSSGFSASHAYALAGQYTVSVTVSDEDGGTSASSSATLTLNYTIVGGGVQPPLNQDGSSVFKYKSTIPVKIKVADCDGSTPGTLTVKIMLTKLSGATPALDINEPVSTSAADTTGFMRFTGSPDNQYIYNLATKPLPDSSATYKITLTIVQTGQTVTVNFGLKP